MFIPLRRDSRRRIIAHGVDFVLDGNRIGYLKIAP
jgi:hypothetical protein